MIIDVIKNSSDFVKENWFRVNDPGFSACFAVIFISLTVIFFCAWSIVNKIQESKKNKRSLTNRSFKRRHIRFNGRRIYFNINIRDCLDEIIAILFFIITIIVTLEMAVMDGLCSFGHIGG